MDGKGHARIAVVAGVAATSYAWWLVYSGQWPVELARGVTVGAVAGWMITPDADHNVFTEEEKRWRRVPIIGRYMIGVWAAYGARYRHRGISHFPVIGTVTRMWHFGRALAADWLFMIWLAVVVIGGGTLLLTRSDLQILGLVSPDFWIGFVGSWMAQDVIHELTDVIWSDRKAAKKRRKKRRKKRNRKRRYDGFVAGRMRA